MPQTHKRADLTLLPDLIDALPADGSPATAADLLARLGWGRQRLGLVARGSPSSVVVETHGHRGVPTYRRHPSLCQVPA
jgi:hypothetical protein